MNNSYVYFLNNIMPILIILILAIIFIVIYNLGYQLHFKMHFMGFSNYSLFYKQGLSFNVREGTGYMIQKIKCKDYSQLKVILNNDIQNGTFFVYLLDKDKNIIFNFDNENGEKTLKINKNEFYCLRVKYKEIKGKFDLNYKLI